jgi:hypothetical protein
MAGQGFDITVTPREVVVHQDGTPQGGSSRSGAGVILILASLLLFARLLLLMLKGAHSMDRVPLTFTAKLLSNFQVFDDTGFSFFRALMAALTAGLGIAVIGTFIIGVRLFFPGGEDLKCDSAILTYSKVPWISLRGGWKTESFPVAAVCEMMYTAIVQANPQKDTRATFGLNFFVGNKEYKIFPGLEASDARDILKQLRSFGVDVIVNQDMEKLVAKATQTPNTMF